MDSMPIIAFIGVSGVGKTELVKWLCSILPKTGRVRSNTTRSPRESDPPGEYAYISGEQFGDLVSRKCFAWFVDQFGNQYGTLTDDLQKAVENSYATGMIYFLLIVPEKVSSARQYVEFYGGHLLCIYVECRDEDELRRRLTTREKDLEVVEKRIIESKDYNHKIRHIRAIRRVDNSKKDNMASAKEQVLKILQEESVI